MKNIYWSMWGKLKSGRSKCDRAFAMEEHATEVGDDHGLIGDMIQEEAEALAATATTSMPLPSIPAVVVSLNDWGTLSISINNQRITKQYKGDSHAVNILRKLDTDASYLVTLAKEAHG